MSVYIGQEVIGDEVLYADLDAVWDRFKESQNFTYLQAFVSNEQNPVYSQFTDEFKVSSFWTADNLF